MSVIYAQAISEKNKEDYEGKEILNKKDGGHVEYPPSRAKENRESKEVLPRLFRVLIRCY